MPVGVETYGPGGAVLVSYTAKIPAQLGQVYTGTSNGGHSDARLAQGIPWLSTLPHGAPGQLSAPSVTLSGTTINWQFLDGVPGNRVPVTILYGVR